LRERGFELKGRLVSERRVQPVLVVDLGDEAIDAVAGVAETIAPACDRILAALVGA